jgi:uncharacterized protein YdcH (DUF465 family)
VPQIEVTFDIDANGIVHVAAKDLGTGKEQSIKITASGGLSEEEIKRMQKEAETHKEEDEKRKAVVNAHNSLDGMIYSIEKTLKESGDKVVQRLARSQGQSEAEARGELNRLGSNYFSAYYGVSMAASQYLGPALLPRPAAPRETIEAVRAAQKKTVNARDLAFIVDGTPDSAKGYLLSVPRGQTTFTPANLLARFNAARSYTRGLRDVGTFNLYGRLIAQPTTPALDSIVQVLREYNTEVATERTKREVAKWVARGDALKDALAAAGITNLNRFFYYFSTAADSYAGRAARIAGEGKKRLNPRRDKLAVRIFMPV